MESSFEIKFQAFNLRLLFLFRQHTCCFGVNAWITYTHVTFVIQKFLLLHMDRLFKNKVHHQVVTFPHITFASSEFNTWEIVRTSKHQKKQNLFHHFFIIADPSTLKRKTKRDEMKYLNSQWKTSCFCLQLWQGNKQQHEETPH